MKLPILEAGKGLNYTLNFKNASDGSRDEVLQVYLASRFKDGSPWSPDISQPLDISDSNISHLGMNAKITILPPKATIAGSISVNNPVLTYQSPYEATFSLNSLASQGEVMNPKMHLKIPAGQAYVEGSASLVYTGNPTLSSATENALKNLGSLASERDFTFDVSEAMGVTDFILPKGATISLKASFTPECETELTGIRYKGELDATNIYGQAAAGKGRSYTSDKMYANISNTYTFNTTSSLTTNAYMEGGEGTLTVTISRQGSSAEELSTEKVQILLPSALEINGTISYSSSDMTGVSGSYTTTGTVDNNVRTVLIPLPYAAIKADGSHNGLGKTITYTIPVKAAAFGTDAYFTQNPVGKVEAQVTSDKSFDASCPPRPATIGEATVINVFLFAYDAGDKKVTAGTDYDVTALTTG
ncbi:hypothetical protein D0T51_12295, partial [Parabacteroides sp. 52]|nr:hypothetical protein [Parabacteroides sp. 52]